MQVSHTLAPLDLLVVSAGIQCCQVYGYIRILRIFKPFPGLWRDIDWSHCSTDFSS